MSLDFTPQLSTILASFSRVSLVQQQYYTSDQLFTALDKLLGRQFDREVAQQLFEQCQTNQKRQVILEDFCQVVLEADKILKKKITSTLDFNKQYEQEKRECDNNSQAAKHTQSLNNYGVDRDSQLQLLVVAASGIQFNDFLRTFVKIRVDQQEQQQYSQTGDKFEPVFNHQFSFSIQSGQEQIAIQLFAQDKTNQSLLIGEARLELDQFYEQTVQELSLQLKNTKGQVTAILKLEAQWIYNKEKYYKEMSEKYTQHIAQLRNDLEDYKKDLFAIQEPFLDQQSRNTLQQSLRQNVNQPYNQAQAYQQQQIQPSSFYGNQQQQVFQQPVAIQKNVNDNFVIQQQVPNKNLTINQVSADTQINEDLEYGFLLIGILALLSTFECFARPAYVDIILAVLLLLIILRDCFNENYLKIVLILNVLTMIMDIVWLGIYKHWWQASDETLPAWGDDGASVVKLTYMFCVFNLITKAALCYFIFHYYQAAKNKQQAKLKIWQLEFQMGVLNQNLFKLQQGELLN
ncbi:hypothetical protein pb186bvf_011435 [Paramecium bursaria]